MPNDLCLKFTDTPRRGIKVKVPSLNMKATQRARSRYENSFAVLGPLLWNTIPSKLSRITKMETFKVALSKYLEQIPDEPPIDGVTRYNSLLDYNRLQISGGHSPVDVDSSSIDVEGSTEAQLNDDHHHLP